MIKRHLKKLIAAILPIEYRLAIAYKGSLSKKLTYLRFAKLAKSKGVVDFRIERLASDYTEAYYGISNISKEDKLWAIEKGLSPVKFAWYGLTKENAIDYLSDFDFYKASTYAEKTYLEFFENKLNTWLLLAPFKQFMPKHFWFVKDGGCNIMPLDIDKNSNGSFDDLMQLIDKQPIAAKACYGGHGKGFYLLEKKDCSYAVNRESKTKEEMINLLKSLKGYIFTEYCKPHSEIAKKIGQEAFAVMRIVTYYDKQDGPQITGAMIRLGCKEAGVVTDYHGSIYCGLDMINGSTFKPIWRENDIEFREIEHHPDTGADLNGGVIIPNWNDLKELVLSISRYLPFVPYLVMDIIPIENGFKILEINSHGQIRNLEAQYPGLKNKYIRKHFRVDE